MGKTGHRWVYHGPGLPVPRFLSLGWQSTDKQAALNHRAGPEMAGQAWDLLLGDHLASQSLTMAL